MPAASASVVLDVRPELRPLPLLPGRAVNLCSEAAACMDAGVLRDGSTRLRGAAQTPTTSRSSQLRHACGVPGQRGDPDDGCLARRSRLSPGLRSDDGILSVTRRANVRPGDAVAIFACGGVGLRPSRGRVVSAYPVIAVDPLPRKRELALALGATHVIDPALGDPSQQIRALVPGGVDHAFEAIGNPDVAAQAFASVREAARRR